MRDMTNKGRGNWGALNPDVQSTMVKKALSPEAKEKRVDTFAQIQHQQGAKNSQFGTYWVVKADTKPIKIPKTDILKYLGDGWVRGRKFKA